MSAHTMSLTGVFRFTQSVFQRALAKQALRSTFVFWVTSMLANIFNWLFNLFSGRVMSTEDFAVLSVFLTLYGLLIVPANALATTVTRHLARFSGLKDEQGYRSFFHHYAGLSLTSGAVLSLLFFLFVQQITNFFGLHSLLLAVLFSPTILWMYLLSFQKGILKGNLAFAWSGVLLVTEAFIRVLALALATYFQWPLLLVAVAALPVSVFVCWTVSILMARTFVAPNAPLVALPRLSFLDTYSFMGNSFLASIGMTLLNSIGILMVTHYFSATEAGIFAMLALFGKVLYFGAGSIIEICVPMIAKEQAEGKTGNKQFLLLLGFVALVAGSILLSYFLIPATIARILLGEKSIVVLPYLKMYSTGVFALIIMTCFSAYNVARKDFLPSRIVIVAALVQAVLLYFFHNSLQQVVSIVSLTLMALSVIIIAREIHQFNKYQGKNLRNSPLAKLIFATIKKTPSKSESQGLPKKLKGWSLLQELSVPNLKKPHALGIYTNQKGEKAVAKIWQGNQATLDSMALKNEIQIYKILNEVAKRVEKILPPKLKEVHVPQVLYSSVTPTKLILLTEFFEGELARDLAFSEKKRAYGLSVEFLQFLSGHLTAEEKSTISTRKGIHYILLFPALWLVALKNQPQLFSSFVKGAIIFLSGIPRLISSSELSLVHRDLHLHNILVGKNKIAIIDWQRCVRTYGEYEMITTLPIEWNDQSFRNYLIKYLSPVQEDNSRVLKQALLVNFAIHGLTATNLPTLNIERYKKMLKFSLSL
jgi:O-antigen/teichoic acid export membrane protein